MASARVSAIVVNYRRPKMTRTCLEALDEALALVEGPTEVIVVDNGSGDESPTILREIVARGSLIELPENQGFSAAANRGINRSSGEWVLLVNNDVVVDPDAVAHLLGVGERCADVGSVAAQMRFASDPHVINSAGIAVDRLGIAVDRHLGAPITVSEDRPVEVFGASGGMALYRRRMLDNVGGLDESFFYALEDVDLAWRAKMHGWRCMYAPAAVVYHQHGATAAHGSDLKYFQVGLNRIRTLAKNADSGQLRRYGLRMIGYDLAYVAFAAVKDRTLAPLRGRWRGLREWNEYRRAGEARAPVELAPPPGLRAALNRRAVWMRHSALATEPDAADTRQGEPAGVRAGR